MITFYRDFFIFEILDEFIKYDRMVEEILLTELFERIIIEHFAPFRVFINLK